MAVTGLPDKHSTDNTQKRAVVKKAQGVTGMHLAVLFLILSLPVMLSMFVYVCLALAFTHIHIERCSNIRRWREGEGVHSRA